MPSRMIKVGAFADKTMIDCLSVAHAQTNGVTVSNALKISNDAKNKWYILSCKTPELKAEWLEHFAAEKGRLEKTQDGRIASWEQSLDKEGEVVALNQYAYVCRSRHPS